MQYSGQFYADVENLNLAPKNSFPCSAPSKNEKSSKTKSNTRQFQNKTKTKEKAKQLKSVRFVEEKETAHLGARFLFAVLNF